MKTVSLKAVVVDDGSTDETSSLLASLPNRLVKVITRSAPHAHEGKGAALEQAMNWIRTQNFDQKSTLIGIIDADSLVTAEYFNKVISTFEHTNYDLIQTRVSIYNREHFLALMQHFEFTVCNALVQIIRTRWGSAIASGNGQFVTLEMANDVKWHNALLEDCEFSMRGLLKEYRGYFLDAVSVDQKGVLKCASLVRQRVRWCMGGIQCLNRYLKAVIKSEYLNNKIKMDFIVFLSLPYLAFLILPANIVSLIVNVWLLFYYPMIGWIMLGIILVATLITNLLLIVAKNHISDEKISAYDTIKIVFGMVVYPWILSPVPYFAVWKLLVGKTDWDKTAHYESRRNGMAR